MERITASIHSSRVNFLRPSQYSSKSNREAGSVLDPRRKSIVILFQLVVSKSSFPPDSSLEQSVIVPVKFFIDRNSLGIEILHLRPVPLFPLDVGDMNLVDKFEPSFSPTRDCTLFASSGLT